MAATSVANALHTSASSSLNSEMTREACLYEAFQRALETYPNMSGCLPEGELWQLLFMERDKIAEGQFANEQEEPGYLQGALNGYRFMLETLDQELTPDLYVALHDAFAEGISTASEPDGIPLGFRTLKNGGEAFGIQLGSTLSEKGAQELFERYQTYSYIDLDTEDEFFPLKEALVDPRKTIDLSQEHSQIKLKPTRPESCRAHFNFFHSIYQRAPKATEVDKLRAIVRFCQDCEQTHFYVDGNVRTSGILLLNRLLIQEGLSPCVMRDVNQLDCLSEDELIELVREGQAFYQGLVHAASYA